MDALKVVVGAYTGILLGIWASAYVLGVALPNGWINQWYGFPVAVTSVIVVVCSAIIGGLLYWEDVMQTIRMMRYLGKVESKWIDPTITNPILRTMPRGETLYIPVERKNWLPEPDMLVVYVCIAAYVFCQLAIYLGWMR